MSILKEKSFQFALEIVKVYKQLSGDKKEFVLSKQLLRSGTAIGSNYLEKDTFELLTKYGSEILLIIKSSILTVKKKLGKL